jgi:hypothetical protein
VAGTWTLNFPWTPQSRGWNRRSTPKKKSLTESRLLLYGYIYQSESHHSTPKPAISRGDIPNLDDSTDAYAPFVSERAL